MTLPTEPFDVVCPRCALKTTFDPRGRPTGMLWAAWCGHCGVNFPVSGAAVKPASTPEAAHVREVPKSLGPGPHIPTAEKCDLTDRQRAVSARLLAIALGDAPCLD
jgi:hypothetical protein